MDDRMALWVARSLLALFILLFLYLAWCDLMQSGYVAFVRDLVVLALIVGPAFVSGRKV